MNMSMISMNDLFYGEREAVQILKDDNREILEIIHRYNYFYTEPPPLSDVDGTSDSEEEDLESNWSAVELQPVQSEAVDVKKDENSEVGKNVGGQPAQDEAKVALKVPMCCTECEETVTIALKSVAGVEDVVTFLVKEMVTVTGTAAPGELLLACRNLKLFRKTRLWRSDSD